MEDKARQLRFDCIDLRDGATLERDRPYLIPLLERLALPEGLKARTNPKSSTGRLDVFTRVITDRMHRFDEIAPGYEGQMYIEVVPRSFAVRVRTGQSLNQLRLSDGDARLRDAELLELHADTPLLYRADESIPQDELSVADGLFVSVDLSGSSSSIVGFRAKRNSLPLDLARVRSYRWADFWEPVHPEPGGRIVLEPEAFYLLLSKEAVCIPPDHAAEMSAYDPTAGELRSHYAGFFDPGFGYSPDPSTLRGSRAALEVRAHDVPFMIEDGQPLSKLTYERLACRPSVLYGAELSSNYQGQVTMLSKHFTEHTATTVMALDERETGEAPGSWNEERLF